MIDSEYDANGCHKDDFICKVNAKQQAPLESTASPFGYSGGGNGSATGLPPYTPLTQEQKDINLADAIHQNYQANNSWHGFSDGELLGNAMGIMSGAPAMGTMARGLGNTIQGINPFDTSDTFGWYEGDTNFQGNPIGPAGTWEMGLQGSHSNLYEKDMVNMFGLGSPEHLEAIQASFDAVPTVEEETPKGGWLNDVVGGLLGSISSSDEENNNGGATGLSFHGADHNWN